jgi:hypothetical protein
LLRDVDFTQIIRGGLITLIFENLLVNPGSEKPIDVEFKVAIDDKSE